MSANDIAAISERIHRKDVALLRRALAALEEQGGPCSRCDGWHLPRCEHSEDPDCQWCSDNCREVRFTIAALAERLLQE